MNSTNIFEAIESLDAAGLAAFLQDHPSAARERDEHGLSPLMKALYLRKFELVEVLREHAGELDVFEAAAVGDTARVRAHCELDPAAANSNAPDGMKPLHLACYFRRADAVDCLLAAGADPDGATANGANLRPLHSAAASGEAPLVQRLLEAGANPNAAQHGGWTALHAAAKHGHVAMARALLEHGADRAQKADSGEIARELAPADAEELRRLLD